MGSKIVGVDGYDNNFRSFFHEDGANLFGHINFTVPFFVVSEIFSTLESSKFSCLPRCCVNGVFNFGNRETTLAHVTQCVTGEPNRFHPRDERQSGEELQELRRPSASRTAHRERPIRLETHQHQKKKSVCARRVNQHTRRMRYPSSETNCSCGMVGSFRRSATTAKSSVFQQFFVICDWNNDGCTFAAIVRNVLNRLAHERKIRGEGADLQWQSLTDLGSFARDLQNQVAA